MGRQKIEEQKKQVNTDYDVAIANNGIGIQSGVYPATFIDTGRIDGSNDPIEITSPLSLTTQEIDVPDGAVEIVVSPIDDNIEWATDSGRLDSSVGSNDKVGIAFANQHNPIPVQGVKTVYLKADASTITYFYFNMLGKKVGRK